MRIYALKISVLILITRYLFHVPFLAQRVFAEMSVWVNGKDASITVLRAFGLLY